MELDDLIEKAKEVAKNAYAPYSNFRVGSAILTKSGNIYVGCNVENTSFGLTICAERNAIFNAIASENKVVLDTVVVYTETSIPATPCGACRQIISEFCEDDVKIVACCDTEETHETTLVTLLPGAFRLEDY